ncbi:hypothetical protein H4582DRAFT_2084738 [Lactarius indigo]|nr:hypothetical protein H4582DRAFT_2084738 [Lactarius indigo]
MLQVWTVRAAKCARVTYQQALYGILCVQFYIYNYNFPKDRRSIKFLAYLVFLLETAQTALNGANFYYWFIAGFGDVEHLANSHFAPIDIPIITVVIALVVQAYIAGQIAGDLIATTTKKNKAAVIKLWIFLNVLAENPTFDGQTKETVSLLSSKFGTKPMHLEEFMKKVSKSSIVKNVSNWAKFRAEQQIKKTDGTRHC